MTGQLVLCADDFGFSEAVNDAIVELADLGKITAASVMTTGAAFRAAVRSARGCTGIELGLHVALSGAPASQVHPVLAPNGELPNIDSLTLSAFAGRIPLDAIAAEIARQFDAFEQAFGRAPDYVDAHQHSHVLPGIRPLFLAAVARRAPDAWIRSCEDRLTAIVARGGQPWLGVRSSLLSRNMARDAAQAGLRCNDSFAGLYKLTGDAAYDKLFPSFMRKGAANHLVICHPAVRVDPGDTIGAARVREFAYLRSSPVGELAAANGLALQRFDLPSARVMAA